MSMLHAVSLKIGKLVIVTCFNPIYYLTSDMSLICFGAKQIFLKGNIIKLVLYYKCHSNSITHATITNEKRGNKQCLLDTPPPRRVTVNNKRLISIHIKSEKNMHIYKSHGIIKNYKGNLL